MAEPHEDGERDDRAGDPNRPEREREPDRGYYGGARGDDRVNEPRTDREDRGYYGSGIS